MKESLQRETQGLIKSWMRHDEAMLRDYLVADVEDPRLNVQSILTRHFLVEALFGDRFAALQAHELRFAVALGWLRRVLRESPTPEELQAVLHGLRSAADNAEGVEIPRFAVQVFAALPTRANGVRVPNYLRQALRAAARSPRAAAAPDEPLAVFQRLWHQRLARTKPERISVLEPACGSANDYRFIAAYGIARFLDYTGFDLCEKNVRNAPALFPAVRFEIGNVFEIPVPDKAFDFGFVHDLFEHLSPEGIEAALREICRVTRRGLCLGFFNMDEIDDHIVRPVDDYHWNTLSMARIKAIFERNSAAVQVIHIGTFLKSLFGCSETHNPSAYTFFVAL